MLFMEIVSHFFFEVSIETTSQRLAARLREPSQWRQVVTATAAWASGIRGTSRRLPFCRSPDVVKFPLLLHPLRHRGRRFKRLFFSIGKANREPIVNCLAV
jgi:hypothetical protein